MRTRKSNTSTKKRVECFKDWLRDFHKKNKPKVKADEQV